MVTGTLDSASKIEETDRNNGVAARAAQNRPAVRVEYPGEGEAIARTSYTLHIAASPGTVGVEVRIDRGGWISCREALGLWWCDWSAFDAGGHELVARARMGDGATSDSAPRRFTVY